MELESSWFSVQAPFGYTEAMALQGYGVMIGTFDHFNRDSSEQGKYGRYYHGHIYLKTPTGIAECAVDVSTP